MKLYLHIGTHKTGSTSIQFALYKNRSILEKYYQMNYPDIGLEGIGHHKIAKLFQRDLNEVHSEIHCFFEKLKAELTVKKCHSVILSSEEFSNVIRVDVLADVLRKYFDDVVVILYLRRQDDYVESAYNTMVQWPDTLYDKSIYQYVEDTQTEHYLDYDKIISRFVNSFGNDKLSVNVFGKNVYGEKLHIDFFKKIGVKVNEYFNLPDFMHNTSLPACVVSFLSIINRLKINKSEKDTILSVIEEFLEFAKINNISLSKSLLSDEIKKEIRNQYDFSNINIETKYLNGEKIFYDRTKVNNLAFLRRLVKEMNIFHLFLFKKLDIIDSISIDSIEKYK